MTFVIHSALEVMRLRGSANQTSAFQEGELFGGEEFDSCDA